VRRALARRAGIAGEHMGALIMLGTLLGLIVLIFALVLHYDPEAGGDVQREKTAHE
jgi:hypothetical protein